jgi:hypothetical protein
LKWCTVNFKYDPFGRRTYKSSSTATSIYAYDGDNFIEETNSSGTAVARYSQCLNIDEPLAMLRSSTTSYYQADSLGSITSLSSGAGSLAQTYTSDSFGKQAASSGSLTNPFQYTAQESPNGLVVVSSAVIQNSRFDLRHQKAPCLSPIFHISPLLSAN